MNKTVKYPILQEPPYAHAVGRWNETERILVYEYNGRPVVSITIPGNGTVDCRVSSDGNIVSHPLLQQNYVITGERVTGCVTFHLSSDALCMRPDRAGSEQAVLAQTGRPLLYGVNGLYDINQDLLLEWHGAEWSWEGARLTREGSGDLTANMRVELGPSPWIISLKIQYYRKHLGFEYHKPWAWRPKLEPISGWCSWEAYRREVSGERIEDAARFINEHFKAYGMKYVQLDDGFQPEKIPSSLDKSVAADWLSTNGSFTEGHTGIVDSIKKYGLEAGIWIYTYVHNEEYARVNPGFIKDAEGNPIEGDWIGFVVDCLPDTLERYLVPSFEGFRKFGYTYLKTDGLRHLLYDGLQEAVRRGLMTNEEAEKRFRRYVEYIRKALGEDIFYLSSWGVMTQMVGIADGCRIACDVDPSWAHMRMQLVETARWIPTQRILFINDPDHLCLRSKLEWARSAVSLASLSGGLFMLSDSINEYDGQRVEMIKKCLPTLKTYAGETGNVKPELQAYTWTKAHGAAFTADRSEGAEQEIPIEALITASGKHPTMEDGHPFSTLWAFHVDTIDRGWCVVGRFATALLKASRLKMEDLGLDPGYEYLVFDFWAGEYLGVFRDEIPVGNLELGCCQILSLRRALGRPQLMASTRHISMDAVSVKSENWESGCLTLELESVPGTEDSYWIHAPHGLLPEACMVGGKTIPFEFTGDCMKANVLFHSSSAVLKIMFAAVG